MATFRKGDTTISKNLRCNERIRISPIRLIDEENNQIGIVEVGDALERARRASMDLVEVAPQSQPPVCRIMDYGKWKYAQRKKEQKAKSHRHETTLKEIRIRTPKIDSHDLSIKVNRAQDFLRRGDRVQFSLRFRSRELAHIDVGIEVFQQIKRELEGCAKIERDVRREGRRITMMLAPLAKPPADKPGSDSSSVTIAKAEENPNVEDAPAAPQQP